MEKWTPPWTERHRGTGCLVVTSGDQLSTRVEMTLSAADRMSWLVRWLDAYLGRQADGGLEDPDFCYFYVVLGESFRSAADGVVDGSSIVQAGYGGDPYGPRDAQPTTLAALVRCAVERLS